MKEYSDFQIKMTGKINEEINIIADENQLLQRKIERFSYQIDKIEEKQSGQGILDEKTTDLGEKTSNLGEKIVNLEEKIVNMQEKILNLEEKIVNMQEKIVNLEEKIS